MIQIQRVATYIFIFFAQIIWPFIVPFGVLMLDKKSDRKLIQKILAGVGILVSGTLAFFLIAYDMEASISGHHIAYRSEEHTSELQSRPHLVCRLLLEK